MTNPRKHTCKLLEMVDGRILSAADVMTAALSYMSDSDVEDMMHMNQWNNTIDEESTEENDSGEIIVGDTVTVNGVEYVAMQGPERWGCTECTGLQDKNLCLKLPCGNGLIFV